MSLSVSLTLSLSVSLSLCLSHSLTDSLTDSLTHSLSLCLCPSLHLSTQVIRQGTQSSTQSAQEDVATHGAALAPTDSEPGTVRTAFLLPSPRRQAETRDASVLSEPAISHASRPPQPLSLERVKSDSSIQISPSASLNRRDVVRQRIASAQQAHKIRTEVCSYYTLQ